MIQKRSNGYGVRIYRDKKQVWVGTYRTLKEARAAERDALSTAHPAHVATVAEFVEWWKEHKPRPRASTNQHNGYQVKALVKDFGSVRMSDITRQQAREWANAHKPNYPVTRALFNDAKDDGFITDNPFAALGIDRGKGRKGLSALKLDELHELADRSLSLFGSYGSTFRAVVLFAGYVGIRPGELFRLTWSDIDFKRQQVHIARSLGSTGDVTKPKNDEERDVVLPPQAAAVLREMPRRTDSPYVFTTKTGQPFSKTNHYYYWCQLRAAAGKPGMDFYELRHFCATELLRRGLRPADVAVQLGHTDGGILVMSTYGHPEEEDARARVLNAFTKDQPRLRVV